MTLASFALFALLFLGVAARLIQLQVVEYPVLSVEAAKQVHGVVVDKDRRGAILDSRGRVLATSVEVKSCALDPKVLLDAEGGDAQKTIDRLASILKLTPEDRRRLTMGVEKRRQVRDGDSVKEEPYRFIWVKHGLAGDEHKELSDAMEQAKRDASEAWRNRRRWMRRAGECKVALDRKGEAEAKENAAAWRKSALEAEGRFAGVMTPPEYKRVYPQEELAAHIVGYGRNFGTVDAKGVNGLEGIEKTCEAFLAGLPVERLVARDARSRALSAVHGEDNRLPDGMTVELTLDSVVQAIAEEELAKTLSAQKKQYPAVSGCAIVMDPYTGDILALASYPTFNPNDPAKYPAISRRNDAVAATQEPGSTFKPVTISAALQEKAVKLEDVFNCAPYRMTNGRVIKDIYTYSNLSVLEGLVKSSNPMMVQVGLRLGDRKLHDYVRAFGFGEKTGSLLLGELKGKVTPFKGSWSLYTMGSVPMGYEVSVTPLQMVTAYCVFANGGLLPTPRLVKTIRDPAGGVALAVEPKMRRRVLNEKIAATMRMALRKVVTDGTGRRANIPEYELAGKTGTANMIANAEERRRGMRAYSDKRHVANFVAFAPWNEPRIVAYVTIRETGKYGGELAAPVVREIVKRTLVYLNVPPVAPANPDFGREEEELDTAQLPEEEIQTNPMLDENGQPMEQIDPRLWEEWVEEENSLG